MGGTSFDWPALLNRRKVVILAEPGRGKTREMQEAAVRQKAAGHLAYFVRIDQLIAASFMDVLGPGPAAEFECWRAGEDKAFFFLDSVDEAKLHRAADFYSALGKFASALGLNAVSRAHIYLTSRVR